MDQSHAGIGGRPSTSESSAGLQALRRLAELVAAGRPSPELFAAVTAEVLQRTHADAAQVLKLDHDGSAVLLANTVRDPGRTGVPTALAADPPARRADTERERPALWVGKADGNEQSCVSDDAGADWHSITIPLRVGGRLWGTLMLGTCGRRLSPQMEQMARGFADLLPPTIAAADARAELVATQARLIAASDEVRRDIERKVRDGAQQQAVNVALGLRVAGGDSNTVSCEHVPALLAWLQDMHDQLRDIACAAFPRILAIGGLRAALAMLARASDVPVDLRVGVDRRLPDSIEAAAFFLVAEAVANAVKHSQASRMEVAAVIDDRTLWVRVADDGVGGAHLGSGSGLLCLRDRIESVGGVFAMMSPTGNGTKVWCDLPLELPV
jgi:signal transduction histidine kinase